MENFAEWFYNNANPWSTEEHLILAAVTAFVLIFASTVAILILAYVGNQHQKSYGNIYIAVAYCCTPLISLAMSFAVQVVCFRSDSYADFCRGVLNA